MKLGDMVSYVNVFDEKRTGKILSVDSDKYDEVKLIWSRTMRRHYPYYWSKKTKSYRPVKEKNIDNIYIEVEGREHSDFLYIREYIHGGFD